jgi:hypothetical protein
MHKSDARYTLAKDTDTGKVSDARYTLATVLFLSRVELDRYEEGCPRGA